MARPRRPVQTLQEAVQVQPSANPTGGTGVTAAPLDLPIYDFAPLSRTITGFLADKAQKDAEKDAQAGERWALDHPALVQDMEGDLAQIKDPKERDQKQKDAFAFLQRTGQIVAPADPNWQVGYARTAGRQIVGEYQRSLLGRIQEVSAVRGPDGRVTGAPDINAILQEEWDRVKDSPAIQNFFGGQAALGVKAQVDEKFRTDAALARAQAQEIDHQNTLAADIGNQFDAILAEHPVVTSETLQPITDFLTEEVRGHNVLDPRGVAMKALELSIQRQADLSADAGVRAVHAAQDLVVGGTRLGDDRGPVGLRLQELTRRVVQDAREKDLTELQLTDTKRRLAVQQGQAEYMPMLLKAQQDGANVGAVARQLAERYLADPTGRFDGNGAFVAQSVIDDANQVQSARNSDAQVLDRFNGLMADGELESAQSLAAASWNSGDLKGEDYAQMTEALRQRRDVSQYVEESGPYKAVRARYAETKPSGFTPEVQQSIDDQVVDLSRRLEQDFVAYVKTTTSAPNREDLHRTWLAERERADLATIRAIGTERRGKRDEAVAKIRQQMVRFQDSGADIDSAERAGSLTTLEAQGMREQNAEAVTARARFFQTDAYRQADADIDAAFDLEQGGAGASQDQIVARTLAHEALRDRYDLELNKVLTDPKVSPAQFDTAARATLRQVKDELGDQLFPSERKKIKTGLEAGKTAEDAIEGAEAQNEDLAAAVQWGAQFQDPRARESFTAASPFIVKHPQVPPQVYQDAAAWMSGLDPFFGSPVTREQAEHTSQRALVRLLADPTADQQAVVGNVLELMGNVAPGDVIQGRVVVGPSDTERAEARRQLEFLATMGTLVGGGPATRGRSDDQAAALRAVVNAEPKTVDMTGYTWHPYTTAFFRSREALEAYQRDPAYPDFLRALGLDPDDPKQTRDFLKAQLSGIVRMNP